MTTDNNLSPFQILETYNNKNVVKEKERVKPNKNLLAQERWEWRIVTESKIIQDEVVRMVRKFGDAAYCDDTFTAYGITCEGASIPFSVAKQLSKRRRVQGEDFVIFHSGGSRRWTVSEKYSRGDIRPYLGYKPRSGQM